VQRSAFDATTVDDCQNLQNTYFDSKLRLQLTQSEPVMTGTKADVTHCHRMEAWVAIPLHSVRRRIGYPTMSPDLIHTEGHTFTSSGDVSVLPRLKLKPGVSVRHFIRWACGGTCFSSGSLINSVLLLSSSHDVPTSLGFGLEHSPGQARQASPIR
jgi:hypothetical protein